jgi:hypothetical protein
MTATSEHETPLPPPAELAEAVERYNAAVKAAAEALPFAMPITQVRLVPVDDVRANDYNPNAVAAHEMRLLAVSIREDGYTQPVVAVEDPAGGYVVVDGFHRTTVMRTQADVRALTGGYLPVVGHLRNVNAFVKKGFSNFLIRVTLVDEIRYDVKNVFFRKFVHRFCTRVRPRRLTCVLRNRYL